MPGRGETTASGSWGSLHPARLLTPPRYTGYISASAQDKCHTLHVRSATTFAAARAGL